MTVFVQVCIAVAVLAFVAIAVALVRALNQMRDTMKRVDAFTDSLQPSIADLQRLTQESQELVGAMRGLVPPLRRVVDSFSELGNRTADLSSSVLHEVETPVRAAVGMVRGVRSGATYLAGRIRERFQHRGTGDDAYSYREDRDGY